MNKKSILLGLTALAIGSAIIVPQTVLAYRGDPTVKGPNYTEERHAAMEKAFESKDFNTWKTLMAGKGRVTSVINSAEKFTKLSQVHELVEQGKTAEANKIRAELGLGLHNGSGMGQGMGMGRWNK